MLALADKRLYVFEDPRIGESAGACVMGRFDELKDKATKLAGQGVALKEIFGDTVYVSGAGSPFDSATGVTVTAATSCAIPDFAAQMLNAVNAARAQARSCGGTAYAAAGALTWNDALFAAAAAHTQDMATQHALSHTGSNGSSLADRIDSTGYAWSYLGENIAAGYGGVDAVLQGWLGSTGHCANLMSPNFTEIAVACVQAGGSDPYGKYWTMDLARPR